MISSPQKATARDLVISAIGGTDDSFTPGSPLKPYASMRAATVKLTDGAQFTGSGVIIALSVRKDRRVMVVATAAHNVRLFTKSLTTVKQVQLWDVPEAELNLAVMDARKDRAITAFMAGVKIHYDAVNLTRDLATVINGQADITRVVLPDWKYDVCLVYAEVPAASFPRYSAVRSMDDVGEAANLHATLDQQGKLPVGYALLQAGYGRTAPKNALSAGALHFKLSELEADGGFQASYYDALTETSDDVLKLKSTAEWTSLPGDSGGPLFAVHQVTGKFYPIGVALGSDVTADADEDEAWKNDDDGAHNNAVTSLSRLYAAWYNKGKEPAGVLLNAEFSF
jgi:hypothetical protein